MRLLLILVFVLAGCAKQSVLPEKEEVKAAREKPDEDCRSLGHVAGRSISAKATREEVLEDLKQETANKGGNYVLVQQYSAAGTSVTGEAFQCP